ncbi:hypothetical protein K1T71_012483 [Dendrolimus kikuchii]|uniref:Uncharacterized protein n=1 Tax=Dendrolimus kikuchii TaxID=765133 RepID=A0ACC1CJG8_9NEOP|nr:hypothetical protein K1T71_012483 [Dendrolimus kikuchii]
MSRGTFCLLFLFICVFCGSDGKRQNHHHHERHAQNTASQDPVTVTPSGSIRGSWMTTRRGRQYQAYRGIRYAEAPVGELRFQPPRPIQTYTTEVDATKEGPGCPQPVASETFFIDEDCLRLNVYTTGQDSKNLKPVLFYMHPGGFYSVSGRSDTSGGDYFLDRDIVVVSINYRLATLGFLATGDELAPGNNGFKDQVMALRWVQKNIAAFGGNPNQVTISGYSAGSFSVMLHMVSPMSKGLFHRAISMSGSPISQVVIPTKQPELAVRQARILNCPTDSNKAIIDCLKTKTAKEFGDSLDQMFEFGYDPVLIWEPIIEPDFGQERFLTMDPLEAIKTGKLYEVPYIISQTKDEFFWKAYNVVDNATLLNTMNNEWDRIAPISFYLSPKTAKHASDRLKQAFLSGKPVSREPAVLKGLENLYSDSIIGFGVHKLAIVMSKYSKQPVYKYEFAYVGNNSHYVDPKTNRPTGAAHHDDLIYLFGIPAGWPIIQVSESKDSELVDKMTAIFYNFARTGNPHNTGDTPELSSMTWPLMTPDKREYLRIDEEFSVHSRLFEDRYNIWEELYPINC